VSPDNALQPTQTCWAAYTGCSSPDEPIRAARERQSQTRRAGNPSPTDAGRPRGRGHRDRPVATGLGISRKWFRQRGEGRCSRDQRALGPPLLPWTSTTPAWPKRRLRSACRWRVSAPRLAQGLGRGGMGLTARMPAAARQPPHAGPYRGPPEPHLSAPSRRFCRHGQGGDGQDATAAGRAVVAEPPAAGTGRRLAGTARLPRRPGLPGRHQRCVFCP